MRKVTCPICEEEFKNSKQPIILKCGHSFCKPCVSKVISDANMGKCPVCQRLIEYGSPKDIPVNYMLLELSRELNNDVDSTDVVATDSTTAPMCPLHQCMINKWCETCKDCLCITCSSSEPDSPHPTSKCSVIDINPASLIQSSFHIKRKLMHMLKEFQSKIETEKNNFDCNEVTLMQRKVKIEYYIKTVQEEKLIFAEVQSKLTSLRKKVIEGDFVCDSNNVSDTIVDYLSQKSLEKEIKAWTENAMKDLPISKKTPLLEHFYFCKDSFVVTTRNDESLYGKISFYGDSIFISNFKVQTPTFNSNIFLLSDICKDEEEFEEQLVYMKVIGGALKHEVVVIISLDKKNYFANKFFLHCSGLITPSYEGCYFIDHEHCYSSVNNQHIQMYGRNYRYVPDACISKEPSLGDVYTCANIRGTPDTWFYIAKNKNMNYSLSVFGTLLTDVNHLQGINNHTRIKDCGVVVKC